MSRATFNYEKPDREQRRARRHHDNDENHGSPKILLLSAGTQRPLRCDQDCQPCCSEDTKGKGIPSAIMSVERKKTAAPATLPKMIRCRASWPAMKSIKRAIRQRIK